MDLGINGNTALITGGASGIGLAAARAFAAEGCSLVLWDLSPNVAAVAQQIADQYSVSVRSSVVDIVDQGTIDTAMQEIVATGCSLDHLVHCAAIGSGKFGFPFTNLRPEDWGKTLQVNIQGMVNIAHAITPYFVQRKQGTCVFLASVAGQIGSQTDPPYSASKAANINFAQCMAKDLAPYNVRVNTVCPGMVQTPLNRSVWQAWYDDAPEDEKLSYEAWAAIKIKNVVPLGRWQTCDDIAAMIVFLSSNKAAQVTGQTINVDGGFVMHW
ncbi:SDR family NAD(P)-dependent oxidoreductase [Bremerella cremea]|uniref:SDR family NAD(P)-dependent oxidoreductase n=1 Tax=Bremerella cremea TaxID=1031537 RepID=A0A368KPG2_9BACT|nr:SDR family oxidoreductase [Bremerella cremea]RCS46433.1 SDR family NAD(P)-dependent oxidoreductase [Bremerella cremea]